MTELEKKFYSSWNFNIRNNLILQIELHELISYYSKIYIQFFQKKFVSPELKPGWQAMWLGHWIHILAFCHLITVERDPKEQNQVQLFRSKGCRRKGFAGVRTLRREKRIKIKIITLFSPLDFVVCVKLSWT